MVRHYALLYGFHMLPNMSLRERHMALFVYKCLTFDLSGDLRNPNQKKYDSMICMFFVGQREVDGRFETCIKHVEWAAHLHALTKELLWTMYHLY